jgi:hypothetical protein
MQSGVLGGIRLMVGRGVHDLVVAKLKPLLLAENVERTIAADGEQPRLEVFADTIRLGEVEPQHGVLHDIARTLDVATENACCVGDESAFMLV